jgi:uncharacterized glyoxalase superfamily protein PhnB
VTWAARVSLVTLGATDPARSSASYSAFGWEIVEEADNGFKAEAVAAGGSLLRAPQQADWGGYSGYFADPDGHAWEVAHNPHWPIGPDGRPQAG